MNSNRILEIQKQTAYPDSISVQQALLQVWNECSQETKSCKGCKMEEKMENNIIQPRICENCCRTNNYPDNYIGAE